MDLKASNARRWAAMKIPATKGTTFKSVADRLSTPSAQARYKEVSAKTGVPWQVIAVIHEREASQRWDKQLGQGDPLNKKSTRVPKGRGPFSSWEDGAIDALVNCAPHAASNKDWSIGGTLTLLEKYNGLGYAAKGVPSPYIWAGTDQYKSGKYVADHVYDPNHVDTQLGCAGLLKFMGYKKDNVTPPIAAAAGGMGAWAALQDHIVAHPYISGVLVAAAVGLVWFVVHTIRNKK
jgi:lysozyme family protein